MIRFLNRLYRLKQIFKYLGIVFVTVLLLYLTFPDGEFGDSAYLVKILIVICGFLIAVVEFAHVPSKQLYRKQIMYALFMSLLVLSIQDTTNDTSESIEQAIKIDSIIKSLNTNLGVLGTTGELVIKMNDTLKAVKDSLARQIITLRDVVKQSEDYVNLKKDEFRADRPDITFFTGTNDIVIDSTETIRTVSVDFGNTGGRRTINLKYKMRWYLFNNRNETVYGNNKRFRDFGLYSKSDLPPLKLSERRQLRLPLGVEKSLLQNSELELLVAFKVYFEDDFGWKSETSYFMAASEFDGEKAVFGEFQDGVRMEVIQKQMILDNDFKEFFDE